MGIGQPNMPELTLTQLRKLALTPVRGLRIWTHCLGIAVDSAVPGATLHLYQLIQVEQGELDVNNFWEMPEFKILPPLFLAHNKKRKQNFFAKVFVYCTYISFK